MRILFIFLDGVGLGPLDPTANPFAAASTPTIQRLTQGERWHHTLGIIQGKRSLFIPTSATLGVPGKPQSGTGQATIVTGRNIPALIGKHYGPKPDAATRDLINEGSIFSRVIDGGKSAALLEAYPPDWHRVIQRGKRLPASYQQAAASAGVRYRGVDDLRAGDALSGDWTGQAWHTHLGFTDTPTRTPYEAGQHLVTLARRYDFAFFPHWLTDMTGHRGTLAEAISLVETFDGVLHGVLDAWQDEEGVVILTSDHGNIEDMSHRHHTTNAVPTVIIGAQRTAFESVRDLSQIAPIMADLLSV